MGDGPTGAGGAVRTTVTSDTRANWLTGQYLERGFLSAEGRWITEDNLAAYVTFSGRYLFRLEDGDHYTFVPGVGLLGLQKGIFTGEAGLFYSAGPFWTSERLLGAKLRLGEPWLYGEAYGGRQLIDVWEEGVPTQHWNNWLVGATLAGGPSFLHARVNYEQEIEPGGDMSEGRLSYNLTGRPGWDRLVLFSAGKVFLVSEEGHEVRAGARVAAIDRILIIEASYVLSNLPPFFRFAGIDEMPGYEDQRGRLAVTFTPAKWLSTTVAGEIGEHNIVGEFGLSTPYVGATFLYRNDRDFGGHDVGGTLYGIVPFRDDLSLNPYATVLHEGADGLSQGGTLFNTGGRITWAPLKYLGISLGGGYMNTPHAGEGGFVMLTLVGGAAAASGRPSSSRPSRLSYSLPSQGQAKWTPAMVARRFGAFMKSIAGSFSHNYHMTDSDIREANGGPVTCDVCHSTGTLIRLPKPKMDKVCSDCHEWEDGLADVFGKLARVTHPGETGKATCTSCHGEIQNLSEPTGGWGTIVSNPHRSEVWEPGKQGWKGHGARQDASCSVCHTGTVQYESHAVASCTSCHDSLTPNNYVSQSPHPDGWNVGHVGRARFDTQSCTTCHTSFSSCRSCHTQNSVVPTDIHHGTGFMRITSGQPGGQMKHGALLVRSGGAVCAACHTPASFQQYEGRQEKCGRCH